MKRRLLAAACLFAPLLALVAVAQVQNENMSNAIINARKKNAATLQNYNWNCRTEILQNDTLQDLRISLVSVNPDGSLSRSTLNDQPGQLPGGFFRRAIEENQRKQLEKYLTDVHKLVDQYTLPSAGAIINFLSTAQVQPVTTPDGKTQLKVVGANVIVPGDSFTMSVDGRTMLPASVQISTTFNGNPVEVSATFKTMANGLNHLQYATIGVPNKPATVMIHNYDYVPNN